jgi:hypothetical protein
VTYKGNPWFSVGKKTFALAIDGRAILKLDKGHQELLFEIRPETFRKFPVATVHWAEVELDHFDEDELAALVLEAWSQIVPRKISRPVVEAAGRSPPP